MTGDREDLSRSTSRGLSPCRVAVELFLKEVKRAEPLCFSASLANVTKREKG